MDGPLLMIRFSFKPISILDIEKEVQLINPKKASTRSSITPLLAIIYCLLRYRKGFGSQEALLSLIENWKKVLEKKKGFGGTVLMISRALDTIKHDLLIAKLYAYCFNRKSLKLLPII